MNKKKTLIVGGGELTAEFLRDFIRREPQDFVIAADRGLDILLRAEITPDLILGDYDSTHVRGAVDYFKKQGVVVETYPCEKDFSDMESAIHTAVNRGAEEISILGACGGRLDHFLANVCALRIALAAGTKARIVDPGNIIFLENHSFTVMRPSTGEKYFGLIPMTEEVRHVTLRGFKYELTDGTLSQKNASLGISNEITADRAAVDFESGILIAVFSDDTRR